MQLKKTIGKLHLYLGLTVSIPFFLIAFSGAVYTWDPEIRRIIYKQAVPPTNQSFVPVSVLVDTIQANFPDLDFRTALYRGKSTTAEVLLYGHGTYYHAQLNPYTGALTHLQDMNTGWLTYVKFMHRNLILGDVGREIVHWVTLIYLILTITGLILWWPRNKMQRKKRLRIKWRSKGIKLNYDLHVVLAFYTSFICIFSILTGLFWGFTGLKSGIEKITNESANAYDTPKSDTLQISQKKDRMSIIDQLAFQFIEANPDKNIRISIPHGKEDVIRINVIPHNHLVSATDQLFFDQYSGTPLLGNFRNGLASEVSTYKYLESLMYDIHLGHIGGLVGRILLFVGCLIAASLPITGFLIWRSRQA